MPIFILVYVLLTLSQGVQAQDLDLNWSDKYGGDLAPSAKINQLLVDGDYLYVAGQFSEIAGLKVNNLARRNNTTGAWEDITNTTTLGFEVRSIAVDARYLYVAGWSISTGNINFVRRWDKHLAQWDTESWNLINRAIWKVVPVADSFVAVGYDEMYIPVEGRLTLASLSVSGGERYHYASATSHDGSLYIPFTDGANRLEIRTLRGNEILTTWSSPANDTHGVWVFEVFSLIIKEDFYYISGSIVAGQEHNYPLFRLDDSGFTPLGSQMQYDRQYHWSHPIIFTEDSFQILYNGEFMEPAGAYVQRFDDSLFFPKVVAHAYDTTLKLTYLGGEFTDLGGLPFSRLVRSSQTGFTNLLSVNPSVPSGPIHQLFARGDTLFAYGDFDWIGTERMNRSAVMVNGVWQPYQLVADSLVNLFILPDGQRFWVSTGYLGYTEYLLTDGRNGPDTIMSRQHHGYSGYWSVTLAPDDLVYVSNGENVVRWSPKTRVIENINNAYYSHGRHRGLLWSEDSLIILADYGLLSYHPSLDTMLNGVQLQSSQPIQRILTTAILFDNKLFLAGRFDSIGGVAAKNIAYFDGDQWRPLGKGITQLGGSPITSMLEYQGKLYVGGNFPLVDGKEIAGVAVWDPVTGSWSGLGSGTKQVQTMAVLGNKLLVGGAMSTAGSKPSYHIAEWSFLTQSVSPIHRTEKRARYAGERLMFDVELNSVTIVDLTGRTMISEHLGKGSIECSALLTGVYVYVAKLADGTILRGRFVKY
jgi:hypothetical protein